MQPFIFFNFLFEVMLACFCFCFVMLILENKYCFFGSRYFRRVAIFAMTTPVSACLLIAGAPQRSTPYFSVSQQQIEVREGSPKRFVESETTGHGVEEQRFCEHYAPMMGFTFYVCFYVVNMCFKYI